jgi:hypothetical protein
MSETSRTRRRWILARRERRQIRLLTIKCLDGTQALPVFSFEEEARRFLECGVDSPDDWQVRTTMDGELISLLYGPCRDVERVALDPSPEKDATPLADLASVSRRSFIDQLGSRSPGSRHSLVIGSRRKARRPGKPYTDAAVKAS